MSRLLHSLKGKFMVSMNDSPNVRRAFKGFHIGTIQTRYIMGANFRIVTEAIITNY
jgi:DNA adenine methylase